MTREFWFTIVVPSFNQGAFIGDCLNSLLAQRGPFGIELILYDNNSTDETRSRVEKFIRSINQGCFEPRGFRQGSSIACDLGLKWDIHFESDRGQADAINKGFQRATGHWGNWLNTDDYLLPDALWYVHDAIHRHSRVQVVYGCVLYEFLSERRKEVFCPTEASLFQWLRRRQGLHQSAVFFRLDLLQEYGLLNENYHYCMDLDLYLRWKLNGVKLKFIGRTLSVQRVHPDSKTGSGAYLFQRFERESKMIRSAALKRLKLRHRFAITRDYSREWIRKRWYEVKLLIKIILRIGTFA